jgi:hypothetical protein
MIDVLEKREVRVERMTHAHPLIMFTVVSAVTVYVAAAISGDRTDTDNVVPVEWPTAQHVEQRRAHAHTCHAVTCSGVDIVETGRHELPLLIGDVFHRLHPHLCFMCNMCQKFGSLSNSRVNGNCNEGHNFWKKSAKVI